LNGFNAFLSKVGGLMHFVSHKAAATVHEVNEKCITVTVGNHPPLRYAALSGLSFRKALKGRIIRAMGVAHRRLRF